MADTEQPRFWGSLPEKLAFPLTIAAATAAFAWFFGPHLTNTWQDRQQHFATKTALVNELSLASAELMSAVQTREFRPKAENLDLYLKAFRTWDTESQAIDAKIATYFVDGPELAREWLEFVEAMRRYHNLPDQPNAGPARKATLDALVKYAGVLSLRQALADRPKDARSNLGYQEAWVELKYALIARRDAFVASLRDQRNAA